MMTLLKPMSYKKSTHDTHHDNIDEHQIHKVHKPDKGTSDADKVLENSNARLDVVRCMLTTPKDEKECLQI